MQSCKSLNDIVKRELDYVELIREESLYSTKTLYPDLDNCILELSNGDLIVTFELESSDINLDFNNAVKKRDLFSNYITQLKNGYELNYELRKVKEGFEYESFEEELSGSIREIERLRRENFESSNNMEIKIYLSLIKRNFSPGKTITRNDVEEFLAELVLLKQNLESLGSKTRALKDAELFEFIKFCLDFSNYEIQHFQDGLENRKTSLTDRLLTSDYKFRKIPLLIKKEEDIFVRTFCFTALPSYTRADLFSFFLYFDFEYRLVIKYKASDYSTAEKEISHKKKAFKNSLFSITQHIKKDLTNEDLTDEYNKAAESGKIQCDRALEYMSENELSAGLLQITVESLRIHE